MDQASTKIIEIPFEVDRKSFEGYKKGILMALIDLSYGIGLPVEEICRGFFKYMYCSSEDYKLFCQVGIQLVEAGIIVETQQQTGTAGFTKPFWQLTPGMALQILITVPQKT